MGNTHLAHMKMQANKKLKIISKQQLEAMADVYRGEGIPEISLLIGKFLNDFFKFRYC